MIEALAETEYRFELPVSSERALARFLKTAFGVVIPSRAVCAGHASPWQAFRDAFFARHPVSVWKASRGFGGKSFTLATLGLTEAILLKSDVNILGGSGGQSKRVHDYMIAHWHRETAPRYLLESDPVKMETRLLWGNKIQALMASQTSVRGPHVPRLRLDEADEMDLSILDAALGQTMALHGVAAQTVISSTHHNARGTMTEVLKRAAEKGWPVYEWCYRETVEPRGWLPPAEVERKRLELTQGQWLTEIELQEPSPENRAIASEAVTAMFRKELGDYEGKNGDKIEAEGPVQGGRYVHGADWARKSDWTVIVTLRVDVAPMRLVAFTRMARLSWPEMVGALDKRIGRFGGVGLHDATGIGDVVAGYLESDVRGFMMVGRERSDLLSEYVAAVERREIVAPFIRQMEGEHRYASVEDLYGSGHLPDTISAMALAYRAATKMAEPRVW